MGPSQSTENRRSYRNSTHNELRGVFHGDITFVSGGPKKRTEILEWISTVPYTRHHQLISDNYLAGTGEWILKKEEYRIWRASTDSKLLLLRGIPGAGKTYIASQFIDRFLSNPTDESKLAYFYCNRAEESRRDPESILRALVHQFAQTACEDKLPTPVLDVYKDREKKGQLSSKLTLKECQSLLAQLMAEYPETTICIDALDEVDHKLRFELLEALNHIVERSGTLVKVFATTRMDTDILMQFERYPRIELEPDDNTDDINRFVEEKVQETIKQKRLLHGNVPKVLKDEICQVLCERSKGMFLLAALQITLLCDKVHPDDVRDCLKVLPETLTDAYGKIYNCIQKQGRCGSQLALNAFRWVQCSYEPLQQETLLDAVTVEVDSSGKFSRNCTPVTAIDLLKACQNLLILDKRLNVFRFTHLSVEEYLDTQHPKIDSHTEIAKICLSLVCTWESWTDYGITSETGEGHYHGRHLLLYSTVCWPWHLNRCEDTCQILGVLWETFLSGATFQRWIEYHHRIVLIQSSEDTIWLRSNALQQEGKDRFSTVCVFGLGRKLADISKSQYGWTANIKLNPTTFISETVQKDRVNRLLLCASKFGDLQISQHLLDAGADASTADWIGSTPLHAAADNGHEALAKLLLDRGADVSAVDANGRTPLRAAAGSGHEALARLLLDRGADVSVVDSDGRTLLPIAVGIWHEALSRLLLDRGADVSVADSDGRTPLLIAVGIRHEALTRLLLDRGADHSVVGSDGRTPLLIAVGNGHEALSQLLLDRGADLSVVDSDGRTPLLIAVEIWHEALSRLLLDRGADVSVVGSDGRTPLLIAVGNGHEALSRMLLDRGADVLARDSDGRTPLLIAVGNGHVALSRLLLYRVAVASLVNIGRKALLLVAVGILLQALAQLLAVATTQSSSQ